jgi:hypothetical protein
MMVRNLKQEDHGPGQPGQKVRPYLQKNQSKKAGDKAQAVEYPPHKHKALSSTTSTTKNKA